MILGVEPEILPVNYAQHTTGEVALTAVFAGCSAFTKPKGPGFDAVSDCVSASLKIFDGIFNPVNMDAMAKWSEGAQLLLPASAAYEGSDVAGGGEVSCQGSTLLT
ncbi:hypothetical protein ACLMAL_36215 [Nocardia sp. CWNU-33]|uniref:hypothetical protein n=1 Tax=Nocardia sp. CWNU-33 TaxID=3392117 RepID=UPI00398E7E46